MGRKWTLPSTKYESDNLGRAFLHQGILKMYKWSLKIFHFKKMEKYGILYYLNNSVGVLSHLG